MDIETLATQAGMRMTDQRRVIAGVLSQAYDHPDVEEVYRRASERDAALRGRREGRLIEPIVVQHHRGRRLGAGARVGHASPATRAAGGHAHDDASGDGGAGKAIHIRQVTKEPPRGLDWQRFADVSRFWQKLMNALWIAVGTEGERASLSSDVVIECFNRI